MNEILIVGAGPTGLTLACELAARGASFRLIERGEFPFPGSKAKGLQPRTLEVFDRMGIVQELVSDGEIDMPYRRHNPDGSYVDMPRQGMGPRPDVPWPSPLLLPQWRTEQALRGRLEALGGHVEHGTTLTAFEADQHCIRVNIAKDGEERSSEVGWVVGCDGARSAVRRFAGLKFDGETHEEVRMLVGDMEVQGVDREHWHVWRPRGGGFLAIAPLRNSSFQVQIAIGHGASDATTPENFQRLIERYTERTDIRVSAATWTSLWRSNVRLVNAYRAGRAFVAGDAAHVHSPAGGQGMNTGIQDAFNLGWKLAAVQRGASASLLDTYESERRPAACDVIALSRAMADSATKPTTPGIVQRSEDAFQLGVQYRHSSLSRDLRGVPGRVRAGDRAPDATGLRCRGGTPSRLFDVFRGTRPTILAFGQRWLPMLEAVAHSVGTQVGVACILLLGESAPPESTIHCLFDGDQVANVAWDIERPTLFVIRPDGVIGLATNDGDISTVFSWLRHAGLVQ